MNIFDESRKENNKVQQKNENLCYFFSARGILCPALPLSALEPVQWSAYQARTLWNSCRRILFVAFLFCLN